MTTTTRSEKQYLAERLAAAQQMERHAFAMVSHWGLADGDHVGLASHDGAKCDAVVIDGRVTIGRLPIHATRGWKPISRPYRTVGGDHWTMGEGDCVAVLADGRQVTIADMSGNEYVYAAGGRVFGNAFEAACDLTPARPVS